RKDEYRHFQHFRPPSLGTWLNAIREPRSLRRARWNLHRLARNVKRRSIARLQPKPHISWPHADRSEEGQNGGPRKRITVLEFGIKGERFPPYQSNAPADQKSS